MANALPAPVIQAEEPIEQLYAERQIRGKHELLHTLRELRRRLVAHAEIAEAAKRARLRVSPLDFTLSFSLLAGGVVCQPLAIQHAPWLVPGLLFLQLAGMAGFNSLAHESWHRMAFPGKHANRVISEWVIAPLLLRNLEQPREDHILHHKLPGEDEDPSSGVWAQKPEEFRRSMLSRLLVVPAAIDVLRGMLTGQRAHTNWKGDEHKLRGVELARIALVHGLWLLYLTWASAAVLWTIPIAWTVAWAMPMALGSAAAHLREYAEHARSADGRTIVYDTLCPAWQRWLIPGGFFNYHALHHVFPEVPQRNLPWLHAEIARTVNMEQDYYGFSPQVGMQRSYLRVLRSAP
jgi:fatty acid desaturase